MCLQRVLSNNAILCQPFSADWMQAAVPWYRILCASGNPPCAGPFNSKTIEPGSVREIALGREPSFLKEIKKFSLL